MPKFVGRAAPKGAKQLPDNAGAIPGKRVWLTYTQMRLLPPSKVMYSLDTTDRGGVRSYAKRWYRWFASPATILAGASTPAMRGAARDSMWKAYIP